MAHEHDLRSPKVKACGCGYMEFTVRGVTNSLDLDDLQSSIEKMVKKAIKEAKK